MSSAHVLNHHRPSQTQSTSSPPPLSPSSFINLAMLEGNGGSGDSPSSSSSGNSYMNNYNYPPDPSSSTTAESSIDFFKYYLDQQKQESLSPQSSAMQQLHQQQQQPSTLSLADIEQFHTFFNNVNSSNNNVGASSSSSSSSSSFSPAVASTSSSYSPSSAQQQPLFPFAEATALPPSAFNSTHIAEGSDLPIDPSLFSSILRPNNNSQVQQVSAPAPSTSKSSAMSLAKQHNNRKKRAVSEISMHDISEEEEEEEDEDENRDDDMDDIDVDAKPATKSARKSSNNRKAISKKPSSATSSAAAASSAQQHPHALVPVPDWEDRPSKEVYDKLSSKEKRQLRNKISARNFRHRRKAHIDTLEAEISQKDGMITHLRDEVGTLRSENLDLRADIEMLKKNWESIASKISASASSTVPQPTNQARCADSAYTLSPDEEDLYGAGSISLPALSPGASSTTSTSNETESNFFDAPSTSTASSSARRVSTRSQAKPNLRKDIAPATGSTIWDSPFAGGFRGVDVHTTLVPDITLGSPVLRDQDGINSISGKVQNAFNSTASSYSGYGQNMNPGLNNLTPEQINYLRSSFVNSVASVQTADQQQQQLIKKDPVKDAFFDSNPFLLLRQENFQDYRGQLYSKLANNIAGIHSAQQHQSLGREQTQKTMNAFEGFHPAFLVQPNTTTSTPSSDSITPQEVIHASNLVQKTLFEKLSSAFWDAFTGSDIKDGNRGMLASKGNSSSNARREVNAKKVADVIGGRSRLEVVPIEQEASKEEAELEGLMKGLEIVKR